MRTHTGRHLVASPQTWPAYPNRVSVEGPGADEQPAVEVDTTAESAVGDSTGAEVTDADGVETIAVPETATRVPLWMRGHPLLWYSLARLVLLIVVGGILFLFGARGVLLLLLALLISGLVSFLVLDRLRNVVSLRVVERSERARSARQQRLAEEDDLL